MIVNLLMRYQVLWIQLRVIDDSRQASFIQFVAIFKLLFLKDALRVLRLDSFELVCDRIRPFLASVKLVDNTIDVILRHLPLLIPHLLTFLFDTKQISFKRFHIHIELILLQRIITAHKLWFLKIFDKRNCGSFGLIL